MVFFGIALFFDWMTKITSLVAEWTGFLRILTKMKL